MMHTPETVDWDRLFAAADKIPNSAKREELRYHLRLAQQGREQALLEDMGYDDCEVCRSNRLRETWSIDMGGAVG